MKKFLKVLGALLLLFLAALIWGLIEPYLLDQKRYVVEMPNLPPGLEDQTIALISDFQLGMWLDNESTAAKAVAAIIDEQPMLALVAGDFIYHVAEPNGEEIDEAVALVRPLVEANIPTYAVLGNHDYSLGQENGKKRDDLAAAVANGLEAAGIQVLKNESALSPPVADGAQLTIVGIGSHYAGNDLPEVALAEVPADAPRVVIMHHPDSFEKLPPGTAPLAVAGHTHGGQFRVPFTPDWSLISLTLDDSLHADGWVVEPFGAAGNRLYVNRGIGMSLVPLRFLARPELTFFMLVRDQDGAPPAQPEEVDVFP